MEILSIFSDAIKEQTGDIVQFGDWRSFLEYLKLKAKNQIIIVIDEFQRLSESYDPAISLLQHYWDMNFSKSKIILILIGSVIRAIERIALKGDAPLFGRRTRELKISMMPYLVVRHFWKKYSELEKIEAYGFFGGTPGYFTLVQDTKTPIENVIDLVLSPDARLAREPESLLSEETRAPATYMSILSQLSKSCGLSLSKIKIKRGTPTSYLRTLIKMNLIEKLISLAQGDVQYIISDEFFRFWFHFIYPRQILIEAKRGILLRNIIEQRKNTYLSYTFEKILREIILYASGKTINDLKVPVIEKIGTYWWKALEVDACAIGENTVIVGEAKWQDKKISLDDARNFIKKMQFIKENMKKDEVLGFFISKSEIPKEVKNILSNNVICLDLDDLKQVLDELYTPSKL